MQGFADGKAPEYSHTQKAPLCLLVHALAVVFLALGCFVQDAPPTRIIGSSRPGS